MSEQSIPGVYSGNAVRRVEDQRLLTGRGRYTDDLSEPGQAHGAFVRSVHAHAEIVSIDTSAAKTAPGVVGVFTGAEAEAAGLGGLPCLSRIHGPDKPAPVGPTWPALAQGTVRHVGQCVALVVAESPAAAEDAAELVAVEYRELPHVTAVTDAVEAGAPALWDNAPGNVYFEWRGGSEEDAAAAFDGADHVMKRRLVNQRLVPNFLEPRAAIGSYDAAADTYGLKSCSQGVFGLRNHLAGAMKVPPEKIVVQTGDVGGGFGAKTQAFPESAALLLAAKSLGRPVKWCSRRSESFVSDNQARDVVADAELALDPDGNILALRLDVLSDLGAFLSANGAQIAIFNLWRSFGSVYRTPAIFVRNRCVMTNTLPTGPYRGAGRPEANYMVERMMDAAADDTGMDRVELRRRNMIPADAMPFPTKVGSVYDSGEFEAGMDRALDHADFAGFEARRAAALDRGMLAGIGLSCFLEPSGGFPRETSEVRFVENGPNNGANNGIVEIHSGNQSQGQGHETSFAQFAADRLGIDMAKLRIIQGDSRELPSGGGSNASRSLVSGGTVICGAIDEALDKGRILAAIHLEAAEGDIEYANGAFHVAGTDRAVDLWTLNAAAPGIASRSEGAPGSLNTLLDTAVNPTFPNGCHIAEVEIDPATGVTRVLRYVALDDSGNLINPMIVGGQLHGGLAQGLGQVLLENAVYDPESGQLLTGSFMDYGIPRADDMPPIESLHHPVPCTTNPLGAKGAGESGTTGSLAAIMNAIQDALSPVGTTAPQMPATPERVWQAIRTAG